VVKVDADTYLQKITPFMQNSNWQQVRDIALQGLQENPAHIQLLLNLADAYYFLREPKQVIATLDELIRHHIDSPALSVQEQVAQALFNKGVVLGELRQSEAAIAVYNEVIRRFADSKELSLQEQVVKAWNGKGFTLLLNAKANIDLTQRQQILTTALQCFEQALEFNPDKAIVLGNQAYSLFLLGDTVQSEGVLTTVLTLGGHKLYEAELADSHLHPLPEDQDFGALLDKVWQAQTIKGES
jgi:tetratricopeptide (TPR) repeat protein